MSLAILGGTGKEGRGLALRWSRAGRLVNLGSREAEKGRRVAEELNRELGSSSIQGMTNRDAAARSEVVVSTLPHDGHLDILRELRAELSGKLLVIATIAWPPGLTGKPSAAEEALEALEGDSRVVAAFQTVSASTLQTMDEAHTEDVLICSDDEEASERTRALVDETGLRGVLAGPLRHARAVEALTGILLKINKRYGVKSTGVRITGLPES